MTESSLDRFRREAVATSGGTSGAAIRSVVLGILSRIAEPRDLIDFGAGKGELLTLLHDIKPSIEMVGADYMNRPIGLPEAVMWMQGDLNEPINCDRQFDLAICSEVIEHLENSRFTMRQLYRLIRPGGTLILTTPNQESIRSFLTLILAGHFAGFRGKSYPAHITALLRMDLERICEECGFAKPKFRFTNEGGIPGLPSVTWQSVSLGLLRGRLFSDNLVLVTRKGGVG